MALFDECVDIVKNSKPLVGLNDRGFNLATNKERAMTIANIQKHLKSGKYDASGGATRLAMSLLPLQGTIEGEKIVESKWLKDTVSRLKPTKGRR